MKAVNAKIRSEFKFTIMKSMLLPAIIILLLIKLAAHKGFKIVKTDKSIDTVYVGLPPRLDTVSIKTRDSSLTHIVLDKRDLKGFNASGAIEFDIESAPDNKMACPDIPYDVRQREISYPRLSDSVSTAGRAFFKRHTFFVIISKQDTCFFYKAVGNYMNTNLENDVK